MSRVTFKPAAEADLDDVYLYIARDSADVAARFLVRVRAECNHLAEWPGSGALRGYRRPGLEQIRSWPVKGFRNYLVFYRPIEGGIEVVRVLHGARDADTVVQAGE